MSGGASGLERRSPPQQVIDEGFRRGIELCQARLDVAAFEVRPQRADRNMHGGADRRHLQLDRYLTQLLHTSDTHRTTVADEADRLAIPLRIDPVESVFQYSRRTVVVLRSNDNEAVGSRYGLSPFPDGLVGVGGAAW